MSSQLSVIIPTRNRPEMLGKALESVRRQTTAAAVHQVIVSENGPTEASRHVCEKFRDLPVRYLRQEPPVPPLLHLSALWPRVESPLVAFMHDDDWQMPDHLENALELLEPHPDCVATFSNFLAGWSPSSPLFDAQKSWRVWVSSGCDLSRPVLWLEKANVLLACLLHSTFHYSTVVARKDAFWEAFCKMVAVDNPWDNERIFPVFLNGLGPIGYVTRHAAVIREHPGQDGSAPWFRAQGFGEMRI